MADSAHKITVRFYVLNTQDTAVRENFAIKLCERGASEGLKTAILCNNDEAASRISEEMWMFYPDAFIPNVRLDSEWVKKAAVTLLVPPERGEKADIFIDLSDQNRIDIPNGCTRIFEIVTQQPTVLEQTRVRFRLYKERGWFPETVKIHA